jgi:hypothetical protein
MKQATYKKLFIDEPHFTLILAFFSAVFEFGCYHTLAQHTPQFSQVVLAVPLSK